MRDIDNLRSRRLGLGASQDDVAQAVGVSKSYLSHIEAGRRPLPDALRERITEHLDSLVDDDAPEHRLVAYVDGGACHLEVRAANLQQALAAAAAMPSSAWTPGESS